MRLTIDMLFTILLIGVPFTLGRIFDPPKLSVLSRATLGEVDGQQIADVESGSELRLKCVGSQPIFWFYPQDAQLDSGNVPKEHSKCHQGTPSNVCESQFIVNATFYLQTGSYSCHYNDSLTFENSDSVYVFVNDMNNLILPVYDSSIVEVTSKQLVPMVIQCLPTHSKTNVSLWKVMAYGDDNAGISLKEEQIDTDTLQGVVYNPLDGFTMSRRYWDRTFGQLTCRFQHNNYTADVKVVNYWNPQVNPQENIEIESKSAERVFVGGKFWLTCEVVAVQGRAINIEWHHPKLGTSFSELHDIVKQDIFINNTTVVKFSRKITIAKATMDDEGWYKCTVKDSNGQQYTSQKYVSIYEKSLKPYIMITTDMNTKMGITTEKGESMKLVFYVISSPKVKYEDIHWLKDGAEVKDDRFASALVENEAVLDMKNLTSLDSGMYSLKVDFENNGSNMASIVLMVLGAPALTMGKPGKQDVNEGSNIAIMCESTGYPRPSLGITFRECFGDECKNTTKPAIPIWEKEHLKSLLNEEKVKFVKRRNQVQMWVEGKAKKSGTYSCVAENSYGNAWADYLLHVVPGTKGGPSAGSTLRFSSIFTVFPFICALYLL